MALTLKLSISDRMLVKPKCIWKAVVYIFQRFVYTSVEHIWVQKCIVLELYPFQIRKIDLGHPVQAHDASTGGWDLLLFLIACALCACLYIIMEKIERTTYPSWHVMSLSCSMMVIQDHNSKHHRGSHHHHDAIKVGACKKGLMKITYKLQGRK